MTRESLKTAFRPDMVETLLAHGVTIEQIQGKGDEQVRQIVERVLFVDL